MEGLISTGLISSSGDEPKNQTGRGPASADDVLVRDDRFYLGLNNSVIPEGVACPGPLPTRLLGEVVKNITPATAIPIFPGLSLARARVHEVTGPAADGFVLSVLGSAKGNIIWTGRQGRIAALCPLAMTRFFDPARLITCGCISRKEILWSTEQALRSRGASFVVAELRQGPSLRESRRLQLAAEAGRTAGLILIEKGAQSSASQTRWYCEPYMPGRSVEKASPPRHSVPLPPQAGGDLWQWQLIKNKAGQLGRWTVQWKERGDEKGYVHMVSAATA